MPRIYIDSLTDPRVQPYCQLKQSNLRRHGSLFIAEGTKLVDRLLASEYRVASVLLSDKREEEWAPKVPEDVPVYIIPRALGAMLVGFNFHVGVVACGYRRPNPQLCDVLPARDRSCLVVVCAHCDNPENLGAIVRLSAAFGADALLLGPHCCDPYARRVLRVSMGSAFFLPIVESQNLPADLQALSQTHGVTLYATRLDPQAIPLDQVQPVVRSAIVLGNEHAGLDDATAALCQHQLVIPMRGAADSLNVSVAAGIVLYHFSRQMPLQEQSPTTSPPFGM
jgi:tRNA G18 (ribose-2'-O)-methylase SpoU